MEELFKFIIPSNMVYACIYADYSGLNDEDIEKLDEFVDGFEIFWATMPEEDEPYFAPYNHVLGWIGADCYKVNCYAKLKEYK